MSSEALQDLIDEMLGTSAQQWLLRVLALLTATGAVLAAWAANGRWWPVGLFLVGALSVASAAHPDTPFALVTVVAIVWRWLVAVDDVGTPWLPVAGICLLGFHSVIALLATVPTGGELPAATLGQWSRRVALGGCLTVAMWALVVLFDRREAAGNGLLTAAALAVVAACAVMIRSRSLTA